MMIALTGSRFGSLCYLVQRRNYQEAFQLLGTSSTIASRAGSRTRVAHSQFVGDTYGRQGPPPISTDLRVASGRAGHYAVVGRRKSLRQAGRGAFRWNYTDNNGGHGVLEIKCPLHNPTIKYQRTI